LSLLSLFLLVPSSEVSLSTMFLMELFSEWVVSPSLEQAHRAVSCSEETSSDDEESSVDEEESSPSSSLSSYSLTCHFFDITVDSSIASSSFSSAYLHLFSLEAIGLLYRMDSSTEWTRVWNSKNNRRYIWSHRRPFQEARMTV
jgi:hypothetical protein